MGIPYYFRDIVTNNRSVITHKLPSCDRLYLDYNSVIHTSSAKVVNSKIWHNYEAMEQAIFQNIIKYTHEIVETCPPSQLLYLGIDGVAPLAKMAQQRKRRHLSALQNFLINDFKLRNKIQYNEWDSNCITPGTKFMQRLLDFLKKHFATVKAPYEIIISGHDEVGEGEHKIINYIKKLGDDRFYDVIYGLDADLIMLSLTCKKPHIYLMRENAQMDGSRQRGFKYLQIDTLRSYVGNHLFQTDSPQSNFMMDYVFICFLLGNDFLPHFIGYDIKFHGLNDICNAYRKVFEQTKEFIIKQDQDGIYKMNLAILKAFILELATSEDANINRNIVTFFATPYHEKPTTSPFDKFMNDLTYMPSIRRKKVIDPEVDPFWKHSYYKLFLHTSSNDIKEMDKICQNFLEGLEWNVDYYFNGNMNNSWYYKYTSAPLLGDIAKYLLKGCYRSSTNPPTTEISAEEQLLLVLPFRSFHLLDPRLQSYVKDIKNGMCHLYPISFQVKTFLKSQLWECVPLLPDIDLIKIKKTVQDA